MVARPHRGHLAPHSLDDSCRLVPENRGRLEREQPMDIVKIAVADPAGDGPNQDLARGGAVYIDLFDRERLFRRAKDRSLDFHLSVFLGGCPLLFQPGPIS
jgi:hypothetical protein